MDLRPLESLTDGRVNSYADVLDTVRPAVVSVTSESIVEVLRRGSGNPAEEFLRRFFGEPMPPRGQAPRQSSPEPEPEERRVPNGLGSGVIISPDGYILTNNHVVTTSRGASADRIMVQLDDQRELEAKLVGRDERTDIALIKVDAENLPYARLADSENLRVGDVVFAIGNPLGVGQTTTMGIVSATGRTNLGILGQGGYESFIQTDAAINRGNSGGALVDAEGRLVGINSAIISPIGANIGIGFAIPSRIAKQVAESLVASGRVQRGYMGVQISDLTRELAETFEAFGSTEGVLLQEVQEGSPAEKAGLAREDIITEINGQKVRNSSELRFRVASMLPGTKVEVRYFRNGEFHTATVTLGNLDETDAVETEVPVLEGVSLLRVTQDVQEEWNLPDRAGILITEVSARSPYARALQRGMVIREVNGVAVNTIGELRENLRPGAVNRLWVYFRGRSLYLAIRVNEPQ